MNLTVRNKSILDDIKYFNNKALEEGESGVCIELDDNYNAVALDDEDWSNFMKSCNAKFIEVKDDAYYYRCGYKMMVIPIASVSEDGYDTYLDINNIEEIRL